MNHHRNKYHVSPKDQRTWRNKTYASKAECLYAQELDLQLRGGVILEVMEQPTIRLGPIDYVPDFAVRDSSGWRWVDVKGTETQAFKIKKKLWREYGPGVLVIVKKKRSHFVIVEQIGSRKESSNV